MKATFRNCLAKPTILLAMGALPSFYSALAQAQVAAGASGRAAPRPRPPHRLPTWHLQPLRRLRCRPRCPWSRSLRPRPRPRRRRCPRRCHLRGRRHLRPRRLLKRRTRKSTWASGCGSRACSRISDTPTRWIELRRTAKWSSTSAIRCANTWRGLPISPLPTDRTATAPAASPVRPASWI